MAKRKLKIVLEVWVKDLDDETREDIKKDMSFYDDDEEDAIPFAKDFDASDYALIIRDSLYDDMSEIFAGTDVYGTFDDAVIVSQEWVGDWEEEIE